MTRALDFQRPWTSCPQHLCPVPAYTQLSSVTIWLLPYFLSSWSPGMGLCCKKGLALSCWQSAAQPKESHAERMNHRDPASQGAVCDQCTRSLRCGSLGTPPPLIILLKGTYFDKMMQNFVCIRGPSHVIFLKQAICIS